MNVALRAVHDAVGADGQPCQRWAAFVEALTTRHAPGAVISPDALSAALHAAGVPASPTRWLGHLRWLGVVDANGRWNGAAASDVTVALRLVGDSFAPVSVPTWFPVATLPPEVRGLLRPPPFRQTGGVMLGLIDRAAEDLVLAAPFIDGGAVEFLRQSMVGAMRRGVSAHVMTSKGRGALLQPLVDDALQDPACRMTVTELESVISSLGSHAKVLLVDRSEAYVGSANLTVAGLARHVEIGVELSGPQVDDLVRLFTALERTGRCVFNVADSRRVGLSASRSRARLHLHHRLTDAASEQRRDRVADLQRHLLVPTA